MVENQSWLNPHSGFDKAQPDEPSNPLAPGAWGCTLTGKRAPAGSPPLPCGSVRECSCACSFLGPGQGARGKIKGSALQALAPRWPGHGGGGVWVSVLCWRQLGFGALPTRSWASLGLTLPTDAVRETSQTLEH